MIMMAQRSVSTSPRLVRGKNNHSSKMNVTNLNAQLFFLFVCFVLTLWNCLAARDNWHQEDPQLIAEVLFAVTSMLSFTRLAYILPAHESLGTLQISIGKMIDDMMRSFISDSLYFYIWIYRTRSMWMFLFCLFVFRFMFILMIIGTAFLCGINNIYVPYVISPNLGR